MARGPLPRFLRQLRRLAARREADPLPDQQLLRRFAAQRDEAAFAVLVDRHGPLVLGVGRRVLGNAHDAEDIFQATFLVLAQKAASIRKRDALASWLFGVAYRLAVRAKARNATRRAHEQRGIVLTSAEPTAELAWRELGAVLDEELARLPERFRAPLVLCLLEGKTQDEAARQLGWAKMTLRRRLERGRELLRVRLVRRGVALSTGLTATALSQGPAVSAALADRAVEAALAFAAGESLAGVVSTSSVLLARGVLQAMVLTKIKLAAATVLSVGLLGVGGGALTHYALGDKPLAGPPVPPEKVAERPQPAEKRAARTDRYGDPLPDGAVARLGTARFRAWIDSYLAFSPDGKLLAGGEHTGYSSGGFLILWEAATGKELRRWVCPGRGAWLAFSADGKRLYSGGFDHVIRTWDVDTSKQLSQFTVPDVASIRYAFSPDATTLASACSDQVVRLWDLATGKEIRQLRGHQAAPHRVVFSPDGKRLASSGNDKTVRFWRLDTGEEVGKIDGSDPAVGKLLGDKGPVDKLLWLPGGKGLVTALPGGELRLWDPATGKPLGLLGRHAEAGGPAEPGGNIADLTCSRDGNYLVSAGNAPHQNPCRNVLVWDVPRRRLLHDLKGDLPATRVVLAPDGTTLATAGWGTGTFWDLRTGRPRDEQAAPRTQVLAARFSPDGEVLATAAADFHVYLWEVGRWTELRRLSCGEYYQYRLAFSADGRLLVGGGHQHVPVVGWDTATGKERFRKVFGSNLLGNPFWPFALAPDGRLLAINGAVWDLASGNAVARLPDSDGQRKEMGVCDYAFSPDGRLLAEALKDCVQLVEPRTGKVLRRLDGYPGVVRALEFSSDGKRLLSKEESAGRAAASEPAVRLWDVATGKELRRLLDHTAWMAGPVLSPDGRMIALAGGPADAPGKADGSEGAIEPAPTVSLWEVASGRPRHRFPGTQRAVTTLTFSPDGKWLVTTGVDTTVLVWDVASPAQDAPAGPLGAAALEALWADLAGDAAKAYRAVCVLTNKPGQAVPLLGESLRPAAALDLKKIERQIADLNSDRFAVRREAEQALERLGEDAEASLRRALADKPSLETRRRVERLLERLVLAPVTDPTRLRELRAVEVLEHIGTADARRVLAALAKGGPEARLTREAQASLDRLANGRRSPDRRGQTAGTPGRLPAQYRGRFHSSEAPSWPTARFPPSAASPSPRPSRSKWSAWAVGHSPLTPSAKDRRRDRGSP